MTKQPSYRIDAAIALLVIGSAVGALLWMGPAPRPPVAPAPVAIVAEPAAPSADDLAAAHLAATVLLKRCGVEPDGEVVCSVRGPHIECYAWTNGDWVRLCCGPSGAACSPGWCWQ